VTITRAIFSRAIAVSAIGAACAAGSAAADPPQVLDPVDGLPLAQLDGRVVWNHPEGRRYALMGSVGGVTQRLPVAPGRDRIAVDLGTDRAGRALAVYPRCARKRCRLYAFGFATDREKRTTVTGRSLVAPTLWKGVLAYAEHDAEADRTRILIQRLGSHRRPRVVARLSPRGEVDRMDLGDGGLAYAVTTPDRSDGDRSANALYLKRPGRRPTVIARGHTSINGSWTHGSPSFGGHHLFWTWVAASDVSRGYVLRRDLASGETQAAATPTPALGVAADAGNGDATLVLGYQSCVGAECVGNDQVATFPDPVWGAVPPGVGER
jgi:hypothetical protein